jgi:hypothetical protein
MALLPMMLTGQTEQKAVPLKNWATPLYWQPNQAERRTGGALPQLQFSANAVSTDALTFVAISPCRLVDTRGGSFNGITPFSGPSIAAAGTITIPVQSSTEASTNTAPAPCGVIPSIPQAYSFNLTVVPHSGGAVDYVSLWPAGEARPFVSTLDDPQSAIVSNAVIVPAGTPTGGISVYNAGPATTDVIIDMNGYFTAPSDISSNTALGAGALGDNTFGAFNTATGVNAMQSNTSGVSNTATGMQALQNSTTGSYNTATGFGALQDSTTGSYNTAEGYETLGANALGNGNTASGYGAMEISSTGSDNTAIGYVALAGNTTGSNNVAIGYRSALNVSGGNGNNIHIGSEGASGDSGVIRIGTSGTQTSLFVAGVRGITTGVANAVEVVIDSNGQLGTVSSSQRFKEDIQDMGDASSDLMRLRPVTFRYKQPYQDGSKPIDYGLIAEEVAAVYPNLVAHSSSGEIETVQYQKVNAMLLNEVQKQHQQIQEQDQRVRAQQEEVSALKARLAELEKLLEGLTLTPASSR